MKKKAIVLNFDNEMVNKKICGKEIIHYFFDFLSDNKIDVVSFPKSSELFFNSFKNEYEIKINIIDHKIQETQFFESFKEDISKYNGIILINYAYPTLDYIFSSCKDEKYDLNYGFYATKELDPFTSENNLDYKVISLKSDLCKNIFEVDSKSYVEKINSTKSFNNFLIDLIDSRNFCTNNIFDLDSNINYINNINSIKNFINRKHMNNDVILMDPNNTFIDENVKIGSGTTIYPGCVLESNTEIGKDCIIYPNSKIVNSIIDDNVEIHYSVIIDSKLSKNVVVGPYAYIRPETVLGENIKVGSFVEIKKSIIGNNTKIPHLSYVGDAEIGEHCNIGCGSIFANYDGNNKHRTKVGNNVFIGSNSNLVAPVLIHDNAFTAAGSTITNEVPENALAIARAKQVNIESWVTKKKNK